ncbi:hypothetical protein AB0425_15600 [Actinosynnema sp. NPDC051121]
MGRQRRRRPGEPLATGLLHAGEEFIRDRPGRGARHTARIRSAGTLVLADGRAYGNPSGALTALGDNFRDGWKAWKHIPDGRALGDLRAEPHTRPGADHRNRAEGGNPLFDGRVSRADVRG